MRHLITKVLRVVRPGGVRAVVAESILKMKRRNTSWGCPKIAAQINLAFGTSIYKDVVRRILAMHYRPTARVLTFIGHMKDSLSSLDLFRCESFVLRTYWVLVVMDPAPGESSGLEIQVDVVDGLALCRIFQAGHPRRHHGSTILSSDHDPLYRFRQWEANLRQNERVPRADHPSDKTDRVDIRFIRPVQSPR